MPTSLLMAGFAALLGVFCGFHKGSAVCHELFDERVLFGFVYAVRLPGSFQMLLHGS